MVLSEMCAHTEAIIANAAKQATTLLKRELGRVVGLGTVEGSDITFEDAPASNILNAG
jgi:hypothetical protein